MLDKAEGKSSKTKIQKREKFVELAESRTINAIKAIRVIGKLGNPSPLIDGMTVSGEQQIIGGAALGSFCHSINDEACDLPFPANCRSVSLPGEGCRN